MNTFILESADSADTLTLPHQDGVHTGTDVSYAYDVSDVSGRECIRVRAA